MTEHRPRIESKTDEILKDVKEELKHLEKEEEKDIGKYKGKLDNVTEDKIIREGLKALKDRGLVI